MVQLHGTPRWHYTQPGRLHRRDPAFRPAGGLGRHLGATARLQRDRGQQANASRAAAQQAKIVRAQAAVRGWLVRRHRPREALAKRRGELANVLAAAEAEASRFEPWVFDMSLEGKRVGGVPVPLIEYEEGLLRQQLRLDGMQAAGPGAEVMRQWRRRTNGKLQARLERVDQCRDDWRTAPVAVA